jgi:uncharacterized membrane protein (DUF106 family)
MHSLFNIYLIGCLLGLSLTVIWVGIVFFFSFLRKYYSEDNKIIQLKKQLKENNELFKEAEAKIIEFKINLN